MPSSCTEAAHSRGREALWRRFAALAIEVFRAPEGPLQWAIEIGFGIIWLAFVVEFVIKITIAECRLEYIRRNWLDLVIIAVPLLRPLRAFRATQGLARTTRVFKMRGVGMKCARYIFTVILGLKLTDARVTCVVRCAPPYCQKA